MGIRDIFKRKEPKPNSIVAPHSAVLYTMEWLIDQANQHDLHINKDGSRVEEVLNALPKTNGYCPCVPKYARNNNTMCPCLLARDFKACECGLFQPQQIIPKSNSSQVSIKRGDNSESR